MPLSVADAGERDFAELAGLVGDADRVRLRLDAGRRGTETALVARDEGELVGTLSIRWRGGCDGALPWVYGVEVVERCHGRGIGTALMHAAEQRCAARGAIAAALDVDVANAGARRLYERLGYRVIGPHRHHWRALDPSSGAVRGEGDTDTWAMRKGIAHDVGALGRLQGRRTLVVGASGGLGRAIALGLDAEGARVAAAARRTELLEGLTAHAGGRPHVVRCDVRDPGDCMRVVASAVRLLGGLDAVVYAPGLAVITELAHASADHWNAALSTNLIGAGLVTAAAIPYLEASEGVVVYLSSVSAHLTPPWRGMGLYLAAKVALEKCAEVWKLEHPRVRFTTLVIGSTTGNEFFPHAIKPSTDDVERFSAEWRARGYLAEHPLDPSDQADAVVAVLAGRAQVDLLWSRPPTQLQLGTA